MLHTDILKLFPRNSFTVFSDYSPKQTFARLKLEVAECSLLLNSDFNYCDDRYFYGQLNESEFTLARQFPYMKSLKRFGWRVAFKGKISENNGRIKIDITAGNLKCDILPAFIFGGILFFPCAFALLFAIMSLFSESTFILSPTYITCFVIAAVALLVIFLNNLYFRKQVKAVKNKLTEMFSESRA